MLGYIKCLLHHILVNVKDFSDMHTSVMKDGKPLQLSLFIITQYTIDITDPSSMQEVCHI